MPQHQTPSLEQINQRGMSRAADVVSVDAENRTVELAFSSEAEVRRWFGSEILDHSDGAMRMDRLADGAALLVNHNHDDQVGVVETARIDADKRGRATVRFGTGARASEIFDDVRDKIRRQVSVGYIVHGLKLQETRDNGEDVYIVTDWEPYEISIVSVAADPSVGVGRSAETPPEARERPSGDTRSVIDTSTTNEGDEMPGETTDNQQQAQNRAANNQAAPSPAPANTPDVGAERRQATEAERERVRSITEMGEQYGDHIEDAAAMARSAINEGQTVDQFRASLLDGLNNQRSTPLSDASGADIGMSESEAQQFSFVRAIRALADPTNRRAQEAAAFEFEASRAASERLGRDPQGIMVPQDVLNRAITGVNTSTGSAGGDLVATDLLSSSFIDLLRNRAIVMQRARTLPGLVGNVDIPRQESGSTGYWLGTEDADATESEPTFGNISLTPRTVGAFSEITRKMMQQSSVGIEALVRSDLAKALALTIDKAAFYGSGASGQPTGIANVTGVNAVNFATDKKPTYAEIVQMESDIAADNADVDSMIYVLSAMMRGTLKTTEKFSGTSGATVWESGNTVNGYSADVTNQIAATDVFFGNFADLLIGMWGGLDLTVDPYSNSKSGKLRIVAFQDIDVALRHAESFCLGKYTA